MNNSTEHLTDITNGSPTRLSTSTTNTAVHSADPEKGQWEAPPVPPIPTEHEELAWRRRSMKRCSYTSHMSGGTYHALADSKSAVVDVSQISRPASAFSTASAPRLQSRKSQLPEHDEHAELHWAINPLNAKTWSVRRRCFYTGIASMLAFMVTFASTIVTLTGQTIETTFKAPSDKLLVLPTSLFVLTLACGPIISRPFGALLGRKTVYLTFTPIAAIVSLATGFIVSGYIIAICRVLAGLFAAPILSVGCSLIIDLWDPEERRIPLAFYCTMPLLGPVVGAVLGPIIQRLGGRWLFFIAALGFAGCLIPVLTMRETCREVVLRKKDIRAGRTPVGVRPFNTVTEPFRMLCTTPTILLSSIFCGFSFAVLYGTVVALPKVFSDVYGFHYISQGLSFTSMLIGGVSGFLVVVLSHEFIERPRVARWREERAAEAEQTMVARFRAGQSRHVSSKSTVSVLTMRPKSERDSRRGSIASSIKSLRRHRADSAPSAVDQEKNAHLAVAAANYLNNVPANRGRNIMPERILLILNQHPAFGDICEALEGYHLRLDPVQLAKVLIDALPTPSIIAQELDNNKRPRSKSLGGSAGATALASTTSLPSLSSRSAPPAVPLVSPGSQMILPPPEWQLHDAIAGSLLLSSGLFLTGWTAREQIHWAVPCAGMGIFACGTTMVFIALQAFILARYSPADGASALAGSLMIRYLMSFAFIMFAMPMYSELGVAWAMTVFAIISVVLGSIPWVLVVIGARRRRQYA